MYPKKSAIEYFSHRKITMEYFIHRKSPWNTFIHGFLNHGIRHPRACGCPCMRLKMKQPPATCNNNRRFEGRAGSGLHGDSACLFFFRLALKINARGGRETEKLQGNLCALTKSLSVSRWCLVACLAHSMDRRCTQPVTGMQQSSSFLFCSFFGCFLAKQEQRTARTCTRSWN